LRGEHASRSTQTETQTQKEGKEKMKKKILEILKKERSMYSEYSYGVQGAWVDGFKEGVDRAIKIIERSLRDE